ncbi:MAG: hypothetical protein V1869_01035 [Candidatus Omnitrophota bacterium]
MPLEHIYYICGHITDLALSNEMRKFFKRVFPGLEQHIVLVEHPYLSTVESKMILDCFSSVTRLPYCETVFTNRWSHELRPQAIYKRLSNAFGFLKESGERLKFKTKALCFTYEMSEDGLAVRLLLNRIRKNKGLILCRLGMWGPRISACKTNDWLFWLLNNFYCLLGAPAVSVNVGGWMLRERRYYAEKKIPRYHLVFSNKWKDNDGFREVKYPVPENKERTSVRKMVFFFDDGLFWVEHFPQKFSLEYWTAKMNELLRKISEIYKGEDVDLLFKMHPGDTVGGYLPPYDLADFKIYDGNLTSESIYSRRHNEIRAVYGICSTSTRTADLYGIKSYVFFEMFDMPEDAKERFRQFLLAYSNVVSIRDLDGLSAPALASNTCVSVNGDQERLKGLFKEIMQN